MTRSPSLWDRVCLVTGSSRGIGRSIALALAEAGGDVAINYAHAREAADKVAGECRARGVRAQAYQADVGNAEQVEAMVQAIGRDLGPITVLVNNAGITRDRSFLKMTRAMWDDVINLNLTGPFNVTHAVLPMMQESGWGRIVNISSVNGQMGAFGQANYSASKGGIIAFTFTLARELARKNITANAVAPGYTETDMVASVPKEVLESIKGMIPMGRLAQPEEIAEAVLFLVGEHSSYVTGQVIGVNGGSYM
jgi:3-oxoacyl-[acyl-carrier protein] reductase